MKNIKKAVFFGLVIGLLFTGCSKGGETASSGEQTQDGAFNPDIDPSGKDYNEIRNSIGVMPKLDGTIKLGSVAKAFENEYWRTLKEGEELAAKKFKEKGYNLEFEMKSAQGEGDEQGQLSIVEDMINKKFTALLLSPISDGNLVPGVEKAKKAGIPVVNVNDGIIKNSDMFVGPKAIMNGELAAEWISGKIGGSGEVAIVIGMPKAFAARQRTLGFENWIKANAPGIKIVEKQNADWDRAKAKDLADIWIKKYPDLKQGKSYWSITPSSSSFSFEDNKKTPIPMGFEEDSEYFGKIQKYMMNFIFVNLDRIQEEKDMNIFYLKTVSSLLNCENLRLISIWSPSFLFLLLEYMETNQEKVLKKVKNKKRREKLKKYISEKDYKSIWKNLRVISCWGENSSSGYIKKIRNLFPFTVVQEKGLLATESFISFPFIDDYNTDEHNDDYNNISLDSFGSRLSHNSHFFEFICTETGNICDISQIKKGKDYEILVTTGGGFYRYSLGDIIRVISMKGSIPYIKFIGRKGNISDLFGEKLNEIFLKEMMDFYYKDKIEYYMFAPDKERYVLYLKSKIKIKEEEIDKRLKENFHYDYCRKLGQLKPLKIFILTGNPEKEYINFCLEKGQKLGNIKIKVLSSEKGWDKIYTGYFQKEDDRE